MYNAMNLYTWVVGNHYALMGVAIFAVLLWNSVIIVRSNEIALVERRWIGSNRLQGRIIALDNEIGIQAQTLAPGLHFLLPFICRPFKTGFTEIMDNEVGLVESMDGSSVPFGRIFAAVVHGHDSFQDGVAFLENGGQKGPQIEILPPGRYRIHPGLFKVTKTAAVVIAEGEVGMVTARDGAPLPLGRILGQAIDGHFNYEDGEAFLKNNGQKGPQADVLRPGTYRINLNLFQVEIAPAVIIEQDKIGLVTALDGEPLSEREYVANPVTGHDNYQDGSAFLAGHGKRGPQLDVLQPGTYYINPVMFTVGSYPT